MRIELRSDTFTLPSKGMREAMAVADVGDDVFGEDPSVNSLEQLAASMLGTEAALFCPTATMCNQIAMKVHTRPMDEIICDRLAHVYNYEVGGFAFLSACSIRTIETERGLLDPDSIIANINPDDVHKPVTRLVCLENTCNKGGGSIYPVQLMEQISQTCSANGLYLHLDGSRLFNAWVETGNELSDYGNWFDTITICLSKGLGAPAGALLCGTASTIREARRVRKVLGGGMRQAGILAAAGIYALRNNVERLKVDHEHAKQIGAILENQSWVDTCLPVESNIVIFQLAAQYSADDLISYLQAQDIHAFHIGNNQVRLVFHMDVSADMTGQIVRMLQSYMQ
ncbi:MAG: threonine aldolase [Chitinophagales bacterium]|nr:threonine aldolase [Chitinophagales bacterium]HAE35588.1 threonine aldolase [Bacteroidota bacterium]MCB9021886.1 threonine aldolase [Chitinophagales bacterium]HPE96832.1 GntG family PLP-dependent aldolase [Chitinophagales bacterium]HPR28107.1 GntG family PLP-dependent aldolase [Chitinophagales bacterium]